MTKAVAAASRQSRRIFSFSGTTHQLFAAVRYVVPLPFVDLHCLQPLPMAKEVVISKLGT